MDTSQTFVDLELGKIQQYRRLAVVPLVRRRDSQHTETEPWYLTLDEAIAGGMVTIREVDGGGRVPEVQVTNIGDQPVLFIDGDELIGAKQNRVVNLTILVPAFSTLRIPVSCVEAGRWKARSHTFTPARHMEFAAARASRMDQVSASLTACGMAVPDQAAVWNKVHLKTVAMFTSSPTSAMADIFERHSSSVEDHVRRFESVAGQVGAIMAIGGQVVGVEIMDHPRTLAALFPKILRGYGLDAIESPRSIDGAPDVTTADASNFLARVADSFASAETFSGVGLGETQRFKSNGVTGAALIANRQIVHLSAFTQEYRTMSRTVAQFPIKENVADALKFAGQSRRDDLGYWYHTFRVHLEDSQMDWTTIVGQLVDEGWQLQGGPVLVEASDSHPRHVIVSMLHAEPQQLQIRGELRVTGELHGGGELWGQSVSRN